MARAWNDFIKLGLVEIKPRSLHCATRYANGA